MSSEALYEQYKDALKRGHVASLRGRLDDALLAYAEAAGIAPERSAPHASAGTALLRRQRPADALLHYDVALVMAPHDEAALLGRAQALAAMDRRPDAADAYDALAEVRAGSGRLSDAVDAARRGLEMAEGRERRRTLERLIERLRASDPDEPGRLALERALRVLDGEAVPAAGSSMPGEQPAPAHDALPDVADADAADSGSAEEPAGPGPTSEPVRGALDRDLPSEATIAQLEVRALEAADAGIPGPALEAHLDLAAAYRRDGHVDAALDACYGALAFDPDGIGLHLALVELYDEAGWTAAALDKLALTERLAGLDDDAGAMAMVAAARAARA
jgi:tetratricopeptide (TPR) repeat protein